MDIHCFWFAASLLKTVSSQATTPLSCTDMLQITHSPAGLVVWLKLSPSTMIPRRIDGPACLIGGTDTLRADVFGKYGLDCAKGNVELVSRREKNDLKLQYARHCAIQSKNVHPFRTRKESPPLNLLPHNNSATLPSILQTRTATPFPSSSPLKNHNRKGSPSITTSSGT